MRARLTILLSLLFILITLPYLYATYAAGPDYVFGGFLLNPLDGNTYLAKMYQGWRGDWRFTLPFTAEPGEGAYLFLFYIFLGHVARWLGLSRLLVFHLARIAAAGLLVWALYQFFETFLEGKSNRGLIYAWALLGAGLGWIVFPFGVLSSDLWVAETYPFLSAYANPHFPLGIALVLWILLIAYNASRDNGSSKTKPDHRPAFLSPISTILLSLILSIVAPFGVVIVLLILGGSTVLLLVTRAIDNRPGVQTERSAVAPSFRIDYWLAPPVSVLLAQVFWVFLGGGLVLCYEIGITVLDPVLAGWNAQNLTPSPAPWDLALSLAPALVLGIFWGMGASG